MDIAGGEEKARGKEKETTGGIVPGQRYRKERGKRGSPLPIVRVRRERERERERERRVAYNRGSEGATRK